MMDSSSDPNESDTEVGWWEVLVQERLFMTFPILATDLNKVPRPMIFSLFPDNVNSTSARLMERQIKAGYGVLLPYEGKTLNDHTIIILDENYLKGHTDFSIEIPNDAYSSNFIEDLILNQDYPESIDLNDYLYTASAFETYDANEILSQRKKWTDLIPLEAPPPMLNWKDLSNGREIPKTKTLPAVAVVSAQDPDQIQSCRTLRTRAIANQISRPPPVRTTRSSSQSQSLFSSVLSPNYAESSSSEEEELSARESPPEVADPPPPIRNQNKCTTTSSQKKLRFASAVVKPFTSVSNGDENKHKKARGRPRKNSRPASVTSEIPDNPNDTLQSVPNASRITCSSPVGSSLSIKSGKARGRPRKATTVSQPVSELSDVSDDEREDPNWPASVRNKSKSPLHGGFILSPKKKKTTRIACETDESSIVGVNMEVEVVKASETAGKSFLEKSKKSRELAMLAFSTSNKTKSKAKKTIVEEIEEDIASQTEVEASTRTKAAGTGASKRQGLSFTTSPLTKKKSRSKNTETERSRSSSPDLEVIENDEVSNSGMRKNLSERPLTKAKSPAKNKTKVTQRSKSSSSSDSVQSIMDDGLLAGRQQLNPFEKLTSAPATTTSNEIEEAEGQEIRSSSPPQHIRGRCDKYLAAQELIKRGQQMLAEVHKENSNFYVSPDFSVASRFNNSRATTITLSSPAHASTPKDKDSNRNGQKKFHRRLEFSSEERGFLSPSPPPRANSNGKSKRQYRSAYLSDDTEGEGSDTARSSHKHVSNVGSDSVESSTSKKKNNSLNRKGSHDMSVLSTASSMWSSASAMGRKRMRGLPYNEKESQALLDLILENEWGQFVTGNKIYKDIEAKGLLKEYEQKGSPRTWQSLKEHFTKKINPELECLPDERPMKLNLKISKKDLERYLKSRKKAQRQPHANEAPIY